MKNFTFLLTLLVFGTSCNTDESEKIEEFLPNPLLGEWELIEILADPGDGSGTFYPVESNKTVTFKPDLSFESSGLLCFPSISSDKNGKGTYSLANSLLYPTDCNTSSSKTQYAINNGFLILYYSCIEPCSEKYKKISELK